MHKKKKKTFSNPKNSYCLIDLQPITVLILIKAPALMNMISHLEFNLGAYLPKKVCIKLTHLVNHKRSYRGNYNATVEFKYRLLTKKEGHR
jgi:hypothetical protein